MALIKITKTLAEAQALSAAESKASRLPSPGSRYVNGVLVNVCPACGEPCSAFPWSCPACGWTAASRPDLCPCQAIRNVEAAPKGEWSYDVSADLSESKALTPAEKTAWAAAKTTAVDSAAPAPVPLEESK